MLLKKEYLEKLRNDRVIRLALAGHMGVDPQTPDRWLKPDKGSRKLTCPAVLQFLSQRLEVDEKELVESKAIA